MRQTALLLAGLVLGACSVQQLHDNTIDIGGSVGDIYTKQVLENLNRLDQDSNAVPSLFQFSEGDIKTQSSVSPTLTLPLGNSVTRTVVSNGVSQIVNPYNALSLGAQEEWDQEWKIIPQTDTDILENLRSAYLYVLDKDSSFADSPLGSTKPIDKLVHAIFENCHGCVRVFPKVECSASSAKTPDSLPRFIDSVRTEWVCLGRHGTIHDRFVDFREIAMQSVPYSKGVLFDLTLLSLQPAPKPPAQPPHP